MPQSYSNNINSLNTAITNNFTLADDRPNILTWLSPLDPRLRHHDIQDRRVEKVGEWLLKAEEFRIWSAGSGEGESDSQVLFCYGDPGVGKTFLSSLVIDWLCDQARGQNMAVACFYFDFAAQKEQSLTSMLGALLKQIVSGLEEVPREIVQAYEDQKRAIGGRGPQLSDIVKMLQAVTSELRMFICIDALDECAARYRVKTLDSLNQILRKSPRTRIFVTGRPHIRPEVARGLAGRVTSVLIDSKKDDIIRYLHTRLHEDINPDAMDSGLEADILRKIPEDVSEMFLLVSLNIDAVLQEATIHRRRQKLGAMADGLGLGDAYGATLGRIKGEGGQKSGLGMSTLMWISHSERPLKPDELCHALAVEIGSSNLNTDNVPPIGTVLASCQGLVILDKEASTVRLIHFTLQEYLLAHPELFGEAHSTIAETCLSYLNSQEVKALSASPSPDSQNAPFLEYSSLYWGVHARRDLSDRAKSLALKLFDDYKDHISTIILMKARKPYSCTAGFDKPSLFSGLHCASVFGIVEIAAGLVEMEGCEIDQQDCTGNTPLMWAAWSGHEGLVKMLLIRDDVSPNKQDGYGQTPLICAAQNGHEGVVKMLLGRDDIGPDLADNNGRTPLYAACYNGHEGIAKILLARGDVNPNRADRGGKSPLTCAAYNGHEGVAKILLAQDDVSPGKPDNDGRAPLWHAAWIGHVGVLKTLLRRDGVNPDQPDVFGQTPLCCAAWNGREGVVEILLGCGDVNPDKPDNHGRTPLWYAAWGGHAGVLKILLGRDNVNPDQPDALGQTPLCCAAWKGHEGAVELLLGWDDANPDKPDNKGRTPLWFATSYGRKGVVKMLLERDDVNPNKPDNNGERPFHRAALGGHEGIVKMLLGRGDVNPDMPDKLGQTPLWWATTRGHAGVISLLQSPESATRGTA